MWGSSFGNIFRVTTFGESHGPGLGVVVDGCPPGLELAAEAVQAELDRRRPGQSAVTTARSEADRVEMLSGVFENKTTGTPIAMLIRNKDHRSRAYDHIKDVFRPGHADLSYFLKYGFRDHRGGGRASGRETAARVAAGAVAKAFLSGLGVGVLGYTVRAGDIVAESRDTGVAEKNSMRCPDAAAAAKMEELVRRCAEAGDSVGGEVEVVATGAPAGLGEPVFQKLDAVLAMALMSIGAVKAVEIGAGFGVAGKRGSELSDPLRMADGGSVVSAHNHGGGILGGISTGEDIVARLAVKPTSSIGLAQKTVGPGGEPREIEVTGRHDPCLCPRIVPVAEAMTWIVLCDFLLMQRAKTGTPGPVGRAGTE